MTNNTFMSILRDYATAARTKRKSYSEAVKRLVELRMETLAEGNLTDYGVEQHRKRLQEIVMREYGAFDPTFSWDGES